MRHPGPPQASSAQDWSAWRSQYRLKEGTTYFNHGSIGTIPAPVLEACKDYRSVCETNPWLYMWGGEWEEPRQQVRSKAAALLQVSADEVALTHNTTEGFNVLAAGLPLGGGDEVLFSSLNHSGASVCWEYYASRRGYSVRRFDFPLHGVPHMKAEEVLQRYDEQIRPSTRVLVFPHIDNMVGLRHPLVELSRLARSRGVEYVAVDGAQALGMIPVDLSGGHVDFYASSPHKWLQSPKGLGLLYVRRPHIGRLQPLWVTWGQRRWEGQARIYEDYGTRNLPELLALGDALDFHSKLEPETRRRRLMELWRHVRRGVDQTSSLAWHSPQEWDLGSSLYAVSVKGISSGKVFDSLYDRHGFVFRAFESDDFNACRLSLNVTNSRAQIDRFVQAVRELRP